MIFQTEADFSAFAKKLGKDCPLPAVFELIGDVGAGKTTFVRAFAQGLGIKEPVTSPSFSISNRYSFRYDSKTPAELIHYDFYRLDDPGLMSYELEEALSSSNSVVMIEWGDSIKTLLPDNARTISIKALDDGSREITFTKKAKK